MEFLPLIITLIGTSNPAAQKSEIIGASDVLKIFLITIKSFFNGSYLFLTDHFIIIILTTIDLKLLFYYHYETIQK